MDTNCKGIKQTLLRVFVSAEFAMTVVPGQQGSSATKLNAFKDEPTVDKKSFCCRTLSTSPPSSMTPDHTALKPLHLSTTMTQETSFDPK